MYGVSFTHATTCVCVKVRAQFYKSQLFLYIVTWVPEIQLRLAGLCVSPVAPIAILLAVSSQYY